jgi:Cell wall-active antibiotics response LiaF, C-terminal
VLADVQHAAQLPAEAPRELTAILSSQTRTGRWRVPARLAARSVLGDCHIELQDAVLTSHVTTIEARTTLGSVTIFVPEGVEVRLSGSVILGSHSSEVRGDALPGAPVIDVRARAVLGSITIKPANITHRARDALRDAADRYLPPGDTRP